jgi:7-cyano-7-deazaguanine reductase
MKDTRPTKPSKTLEIFKNPAADPYFIDIICPEFTCLCPITGQPDFATFRIRYVPNQHCVELKSLKLYLWSFRDEGAFHEAVTHEICNKIAKLIKARYLRVVGDFYVRGGIHTVVRVSKGAVPKELAHEPDPETAYFLKTPGL